MPQGKYFRIGYGIALFLLIVLLASKVDFLFQPVSIIFRTLFLPIFVSGILYYLLRPVVSGLEKLKLARWLAILIVYLAGFGIITAASIGIGPYIASQFNSLIESMPQLVKAVQKQLAALQEQAWFGKYLQENNVDWSKKAGEYLNQVTSVTLNSVQSIIGFLTKFLVVLTTVPFILYYMLSQGEKVPRFIMRLIPEEQEEDGMHILREMDTALSSYLQGKVLLSICLGLLVFIGYAAVGLEYPLILAICMMFFNLIPYVGGFIGAVPAVIMAFIDSPSMVVKVVIIVLIAQQIESNVLSPQIMGRKLNIHPLTIILILLVAGSFGGLLGMFLAVPVYAVAREIITYFYKLHQLRNRNKDIKA
ncbi:AI-2E family transporter [Paenibacillus sp. GCM10027626]|uniref:AI-2E family transporter n=1 Tax=Paenibacillus sp. GCM10027626 TaxID=3273411 RepID=UPI003639435F